jgi:hypothetical protein
VGSTQATTSIYTDVYIHIYTLFSTLFRTKFTTKQSLIHYEDHEHHSTHQSSSITTKKKIFPQISTQIHNFSQDFTIKKHQKTPKSPKSRKTRKNRLFGGTPPPPPKNPYFPGFSDPPKLHKFAQICTNLHQFAPPKHHFWGVPNLPGPSG